MSTINREYDVNIVDKTLKMPPERVYLFANEISNDSKGDAKILKSVASTLIQELSKKVKVEEQGKLLALLFLIESSSEFFEGTEEFLTQLSGIHGVENNFSLPFKRFLSKRLQIARNATRRLKIGNPEDGQAVLHLMQTNSQFFLDLIELQDFFSQNISPVLALNGTWNPLCTQRFGLRGIAGLKYVYSHNENNEYRRLMKQQMSSEWTGFNRFREEPWSDLENYIDKDGDLLDIGSSIGISALEIADILDIKGSVILVDSGFCLKNGRHSKSS